MHIVYFLKKCDGLKKEVSEAFGLGHRGDVYRYKLSLMMFYYIQRLLMI